jgi:hypothetical protein
MEDGRGGRENDFVSRNLCVAETGNGDVRELFLDVPESGVPIVFR